MLPFFSAQIPIPNNLVTKNCQLALLATYFLECCRYLMMFMTQFNAVADQLVKTLSRVANGQNVFSMHKYFCHVTMDVIAEVYCLTCCVCM